MPNPTVGATDPCDPPPLDASRDDRDGRDIQDSPGRLGCPVYSSLSTILSLFTANIR